MAGRGRLGYPVGMSRLPLLCALVSILLIPAWGPAAEPEPIVALRAELDARMRELRPLLERLESLAAVHGASRDPEALRAESESLRRRAAEGLRALDASAESFASLKSRYELTYGGLAASRLLRGARPSTEPVELREIFALDTLAKNLKSFQEEAALTLAREQAAFERARAEAARGRRRRLAWTGVLLAAGLAILGAFVRRARHRESRRLSRS